ncbi:MAG: peptidase T, partial [Clostridia bacterium]|nr:peptidase T [Clostridia bacterium]
MRAYERLLAYVRFGTASDEESGTVPSTKSQFALAEALVNELKGLGLADAAVDDKCYVYATLSATAGKEEVPALGFIAHLDTSPDFEGNGVSPRIIPDYDGGDVPLGTSGRVLRVSDFPHLKAMRGRTLIVTNGETLLGADDKAGIAEIMTMLEIMQKEKRPHGKICVAFTPDEEIGAGA